MMHVEYKVMLPDHDFVKGAGHKLIPSVNAICEITDDNTVSHKGPMFIKVRSGKHDGSSAKSHHQDFESILDSNPAYQKPILVMSVDGGPDENPRFPKTLAYAISKFKSYDFDFMVMATHAPGNSAFNFVERRMAPLSKELAGVVLPHDHYGSHLDTAGKTVDPELERQNFQHAGETLAEVVILVTVN